MTKIRQSFVSKTPLKEAFERMNLSDYIIRAQGQPIREKMQSDVFESICAAIYLDGGLKNAQHFIFNNLAISISSDADRDFKTELQELVQRKGGKVVYTTISKDGPDHQPSFTEGVLIGGNLIATGCAPSKKAAQQLAAKAAIKTIAK